MDLPKMLTSPEVEAALNVSRPTLRRLVDTGAIPATKVGQNFRFWPEDVAAYLEANRVAARAAS